MDSNVFDKNENNNDINRKRKIGFIESLYIPAIIQGLFASIRHFFRRRKFTVQYPEQKKVLSPRYRGEHRLKKDEKGRMKCVACFMCAVACPAECIHIEATEAPAQWEGRDKIPSKFIIDELRCIFCGMCIEACPKDAIEMTQKIQRVYADRQSYIYDMAILLNNEEKRSDWIVEDIYGPIKTEKINKKKIG